MRIRVYKANMFDLALSAIAGKYFLGVIMLVITGKRIVEMWYVS